MTRISVLVLVVVGILTADVRAIVVIYLDEIDGARTVSAVAGNEKVIASCKEINVLHQRLLKLKKPALIALLGKPVEKPAKTFALPVAERHGIALPGLRDAADNRPDSDFVTFHPIGDYAAVEVYYARDKEGDTPIVVVFYLKIDPAFPKLTADNLDRRLAWENERLKKLAERIANGDPLGLGPNANRAVAVGDWSDTVSELRGRLLIVEGRPLGDGRVRETAVYVELQNVSTAVGQPMNIYFDNRLSCELRNSTGNIVSPEGSGGSGGRPGPCWVTLPYDSSIRLRANPYGFGRAKGAGFLIPLVGKSWIIPAGDHGDYSLSGTFTVTPPDGHDRQHAWSGTLTFPKMAIHPDR